MIRELLAAFAVLIVCPLCMGLFPARFMPGITEAGMSLKGKKIISVCPVVVYLAGFLLELAVFQILAVPVILLKPWGFSMIVTAYSLLLTLCSLAGLLFGRPVLMGMGNYIREFWGGARPSVETCIYWVLAAGLVLFQVYMAYTHAFFDGDDAYYVVQSVIAEQTDVLYRILPYTGQSTLLDVRHALATLPIWEAYLARITGIHPAIIAHSVLPLVLIPVTYLVYFRIGMRLFQQDGRKTACFLILVSLLQIFGNTSIYTNATFFLMRTWQGKSLLCNLVLLTTVWILMHLWEQDFAAAPAAQAAGAASGSAEPGAASASAAQTAGSAEPGAVSGSAAQTARSAEPRAVLASVESAQASVESAQASAETGEETAGVSAPAPTAVTSGGKKPARRKKYGQAGWWILLCANNVIAAMATTMGAFLVGILIAVIGLVWAVRCRRPTVLLPLAASCIPCVVYLAIYAAYVM